MKEFPRISFGIIVLNGEPFTRYNLRSLFPYAYEIIVVEGASIKAKAISTPSGHSLDGTLEVLHRFKNEEDPENKLTIITAEDMGYKDGFWPGDKDEQSEAYARHATGDYLWQIDIDEFYKSEDIETIISMLRKETDITQINVLQYNFWGGFDSLVDGLFLRQFYAELHGVPRIFKWGEGYKYITHRPPTIIDADGKDLRQGRWIRGNQLAKMGIYCYHYATIFTQAVQWKMEYYQSMGWGALGDFVKWYSNEFKEIRRPFRIHHAANNISWLKPYYGSHPRQIEALMVDISKGVTNSLSRRSDDIQQLLESRKYLLGIAVISRCSDHLLKIKRHTPRLSAAILWIFETLFTPETFKTRSKSLT
jgi:hypothetical protein